MTDLVRVLAATAGSLASLIEIHEAPAGWRPDMVDQLRAAREAVYEAGGRLPDSVDFVLNAARRRAH